jgi:hypothetical protein
MRMLSPSLWPNRSVMTAGVLLLCILGIELTVPLWRQSPIFDEGCHILAGYSYWTRGDYGINPEHPPLVKLRAALPLLTLHPHYPSLPPGFFKFVGFVGGKQLLFSNNADQILTRARLAVSLLTLLTALLVFAAAAEMFGRAVALLALVLVVFEPNLIANGSLVTTDMAMALFLFATVYAFYRYTTNPTIPRLLVTGFMAGLCLVAKHSGVLGGPILLLLAAVEVALHRSGPSAKQQGRAAHSVWLLGSLVVIGLISITILWAFYGFRFAMRPAGQGMIPNFPSYVGQTGHPAAERVILTVARHHTLPEAYLYGFADIMIAPRYVTPYLFGKVYPRGLWVYPIATFVIKSTLGFLLLLLTVPICFFLNGVVRWRDVLYLTIPALVYAIAAVTSRFNHGNRYLVPMYPFLIILAAYAAWRLAAPHRTWAYAIAALVALHVVSSIRTFPDYLPYSNEAWGGPSNPYKFLSDSNVDWGQQLKIAKKYLDAHGIRDCWFDYFARSVSHPDHYGIPCKPLPDSIGVGFGLPPAIIPPRIEGIVLISSDEMAGDI